MPQCDKEEQKEDKGLESNDNVAYLAVIQIH